MQWHSVSTYCLLLSSLSLSLSANIKEKISITEEIPFCCNISFFPLQLLELSNILRNIIWRRRKAILFFQLICFFLWTAGQTQEKIWVVILHRESLKWLKQHLIYNIGAGSQDTRKYGLKALSVCSRIRRKMYCLREKVFFFFLSEQCNCFRSSVKNTQYWGMCFYGDNLWEYNILLKLLR